MDLLMMRRRIIANPSREEYIVFVDPEAERICATNWGDGTGITKSQASVVTNIGSVFADSTIESFDELKYFTGLRTIAGTNNTRMFYGCTLLEGLTIPEGVTAITQTNNYFPFRNCLSLTRIGLPSTLKSIGNGVFNDSTANPGPKSLERIDINSIESYLAITFGNTNSNPFFPSTATTRGLYLNDTLVTHLEIPNGTTKIGNYSFFKNNTLTGVTIPSSFTTSGNYSFSGATNLSNIIYLGTLEQYLRINWTNSYNGHPYCGRSSGGPLWLGDVQVTAVTIPSNITTIRPYAFYRVRQVTSLTLHNNLTSIGKQAFFAFAELTGLTIPSSVTSINESAFGYCRSLTDVTVPSSVTTIGDGIFQNCSGLADVTFMSETLNFNFRMISITTNSVQGCGTGTLRIKSNAAFTGMTQITFKFKKIICEKNLTMSSSFWAISNGNMTIQQIRVGGDFISTATQQQYAYVVSPHGNVNVFTVSFMEIMGTITANYVLFRNAGLANGFIIHLGYDAYTNNVVPCAPNKLGVGTVTKIDKVYVGKGVSAQEDNNILSVYAADTDWSTQVNNGKVDTWYNYIHSQDANPDFIN